MPLYEPILPARYAAVLMDAVNGMDPARVRAVLRAAGLSARLLRQPEAVVGIGQFDRLMQAAAAVLGRDDIGFEYGMRLGIDHHAALGMALRRCRTGDELLRMMNRYWRLTTTCFSLQYRRGTGAGEVLFRPVAPMAQSTLHQMEEMFAVSFHRDLMAMTGNRQGLAIRLSMPRPPHHARYRALQPTVFQFGAENLPQVRCIMSPALLDSALQHPAPARADAATALALPDDAAPRIRLCADYVKLVLGAAEGVQPGAAHIADWLNVSPRTLVRHLAAEGYAFRELGVEIRHRRACQMLTQSSQPVGQIAQRLGYGSVIAFSTAFKRSAGLSPRAYRAVHAG